MAQNSSTWSIPNISITTIPPNPIDTQMYVSEGPGNTPGVSSKENPQSKFPHEFLLNPGRNPVASQDPFGQSKKPTLNISSGSQVNSGLLEGNPELTLHQNMAPKGKSVQYEEPIEDCDELYASSPLVHKEKVTGNHHPYASKPRKGHSSSSRERILDDEGENISPTQNETNDEPRRDNFMEHE
ncbi:hypothetical protein O181_054909 [Austropuccinia psidii MF-1]|uniref:Uncharacterized protein n=1 Tax=Austropuccinia psidii MF-1 TaxID=1389203 RepID=A0A9Q3E5H6_9BASI|nr:hypothetical protein [Austropuccinia psidii MF-1]